MNETTDDGYDWLRAAVAPRDSWMGWEAAIGPIVLLLGCASSVLANWVWGSMIGDVSCAWQLSYSPMGPAFGIWAVIYFWTFASVLFQLLSNMDLERWAYAEFGSNVLMFVAWVACSLWVRFFSLADSKNIKDGLGWAAICLVLAAVCALSAVVWEHSWRFGDTTRVLTIGVPFSLYTGWLLLAASLSVGIFLASRSRPPDECDEDRELKVVIAEGGEKWVPAILAASVAAFALGLPDPILPVPVLWGLYWVRRSAGSLLGMAIALSAIVGAALLVPRVV